MRYPDVQSAINEMTEVAMRTTLWELSRSVYWPAILRYLDSRKSFAEGGLKTIDAFKEPTNMARTQGFINGVSDLEEAVNMIKEEVEEQQKATEEGKKKEG